MKQAITILLAIAILIASGFVYRYTEKKYGKDSLREVVLPVPLNEFPLLVGNWEGLDIPLSDAVQKVAGNDDFVNRQYINKSENKWASFYLAYTGQPRNMIGHRPSICYVGAGWIHDNTEITEFESKHGIKYPCLIHHFSRPKPDSTSVVVLNYYILNGTPTNKESEFNSLSFRLPNIDGEIAKYVAQIQVSSSVKSSVLEFAALTADDIIKYLPDESGKVEIANDEIMEIESDRESR